MFEESDGLLLDKLSDHIAKHSAYSIESLVGVTDIAKPCVIEKNLLHDKDCYRLAQLRASFHNPQAQRDDFGCQ